MNKNWKLTAAFGVILALLSAAYFFSKPPASTNITEMDPHVVEGLKADQVTKIEVDRKGTLLTFEKANDTAGEFWRIVAPSSHAAETALVQQMLFGLDRFLKAGALEAGKPGTEPETTGLNDPRLSVTFSAAGRREVLRFGKSPMTNTTVVFYQHDGDPKIYSVSVDTFEAFNKPVFQYRAKTLARFTPHRVNKVVLDYKFLRLKEKDKPPVVEYEKSVFERFEEGAERGWYLTSPHRERLNDHSVAALITELSNLSASEYQPAGNPKEQGFDEPQVRVALHGTDREQPVVILIGGPTQNEKKRWVQLQGSDEVALYDAFRYEEIRPERKNFRNKMIFPFSVELVKRLEIEVKDLGKTVVERREVKKEGETVSTVKWEVLEPTGLRVEAERVEAFVAGVVVAQIADFLGAQDFKQAGLDPAPIRLLIETKEGKKHACGFTPAGYLRKEGVDEIFEVKGDIIRMLQRLELNFLNFEMFNIQRSDLREFTFESRPSSQLQPIYYSVRQKGTGWVFVDPAHQGVETDPNLVNNLVNNLNYIRAELLIGRDDKTIRENRLDETTAPATLKIVHEKGVVELYISENLNTAPGTQRYWARFKDNKTVFQINPLFVETLRTAPEKKKEK